MTSNDPTWDAPAVAPEVWEAMEDVERLYAAGTQGEWGYDADRGVLFGEDDLVAELFNESWVNGTAIDGEPTQYRESLPADKNGALIAALHTHWPAVAAALRSLAGRVLDLEQQERQRATALEGLREENERLQGQRDALRETAMLIVRGPHGGPKLRSNLAALLRVAEACDAALAEGSER